MTWYSVHVATRNPAGGRTQADLPGLDDLHDLLAEHSASVAGGQAGYSATVSIDTHDGHEASSLGYQLVHEAAQKAGLPDWPVVRLEVLDHDELARDLERPQLPDMVSGQVAADLLGVSRQRLHQLRDNPRFPKPLIDRPGAILWSFAAIDRFNAGWERRPGRPPASSSGAVIDEPLGGRADREDQAVRDDDPAHAARGF